MKKISRLLIIIMVLVTGAAIAEAQQPKKVPRIGYLSQIDPASESARSEAIRRALRERGYIEGQNIAFEYRYAEGKRDRFPELAAELVRLKAGLIESLARPGGNVTGITILTTELGGKRLQPLKEAVPKVARVAVLYDPAVPANAHDVKEVLPGAARFRLNGQAALGWTLRGLGPANTS
jgi:putative ABC transport system substrate-binding protein